MGQVADPLATISFARTQWSSSAQYSLGFTGLLSQSSSAADNGMTVSMYSGFSRPGWADLTTLGHVANGVWTDTLSKYGTTTFSFGDPIYGFGGNFDVALSNGLYIGGAGNVAGGSSAYDGFIGVISDQPLDSLWLSWGSGGDASDIFGNSYILSNLQVGVVPIPEPDYRWAYFGLPLVVLIWCRFVRR